MTAASPQLGSPLVSCSHTSLSKKGITPCASLRSLILGASWKTFWSVRLQSFWDRERLKIRESLARLVCNVMRLDDGASSGD
jgi:hypothetical protein